ncbi:Cleavage stimulation factor subunit 50 [Glycine soja]
MVKTRGLGHVLEVWGEGMVMILTVLPSAEGRLHRHAGNGYLSLLTMLCCVPEAEAAVAGDELMVDVDAHDTGPETDAQDIGAQDAVDEPEGFPGEPRDPSVLTEYADHVAASIWSGQERPELKLSSHGRKVHNLGRPVPAIEDMVVGTGLSPLIACSIDTDDRGLISSFIERWHRETSSFHLPVGEVSIMLDNVASLLHLPIIGAFHDFQPLRTNEAVLLLVELLMVSAKVTMTETDQCGVAYVCLQWLRDVYQRKCQTQHWIAVARAYLLHLLDCTLFANKSATHALCDLTLAGWYAWGATVCGSKATMMIHQDVLMMPKLKELIKHSRFHSKIQESNEEIKKHQAKSNQDTFIINSTPLLNYSEATCSNNDLVHMYDQLNDVSLSTSRQFAGYITLLQLRSAMLIRTTTRCEEGIYSDVQAAPGSSEDPRCLLDAICGASTCAGLSSDFVLLGTALLGAYTDMRGLCASLAMSSAFLHTLSIHGCHMMTWTHYLDHLAAAGQCAPDYIDWFFVISHPFMTAPQTDPPRDAYATQPSHIPHEVAPTLTHADPDADEPKHAVEACHAIAEALEQHLNTLGTSTHEEVIQKCLRIAKGVTEDHDWWHGSKTSDGEALLLPIWELTKQITASRVLGSVQLAKWITVAQNRPCKMANSTETSILSSSLIFATTAASAVASATMTPLNVEAPPNRLLDLVAKGLAVEKGDITRGTGSSKSFPKHETRHLSEHKVSKIKQMLLPEAKDGPVRPVIRTYYDHIQPINDLDFHPQGTILISGAKDQTIKFFDISKTNAKRAYRVIQDTHNVRSVSFHPSGDFLLAGTDHAIPHLYDINTFQCYLSANIPETSPSSMYVTASKDGAIRLWDGITANCVRSITAAHGTAEATSAIFTKDQRFVLSCGKDSTLKLWEVGSGRLVKQYLGAIHTQLRCQAIFNETEEFILSIDELSNEIVIWDAMTTEKVAKWPSNHVGAPRWLEHSPIESAFISCGTDRSVRFWKETV